MRDLAAKFSKKEEPQPSTFGIVTGSTSSKVAVNMEGSTQIVQLNYLSSYTPTNGDKVLILRTGKNSFVVVGKLAV